MYVLGNLKITDDDSKTPVKAFVSNMKATDIMTWHRQFVHADIDIIKSMQPLVNGLNITSIKEEGKCKDCIRGKITAAPHTRPR